MPRPAKDFPLAFRRDIEKRLKTRDRDERALLKLVRAYIYLSDDYATFASELQELERRYPEMGETDKNARSHLRESFTGSRGTSRRKKRAPR